MNKNNAKNPQKLKTTRYQEHQPSTKSANLSREPSTDSSTCSCPLIKSISTNCNSAMWAEKARGDVCPANIMSDPWFDIISYSSDSAVLVGDGGKGIEGGSIKKILSCIWEELCPCSLLVPALAALESSVKKFVDNSGVANSIDISPSSISIRSDTATVWGIAINWDKIWLVVSMSFIDKRMGSSAPYLEHVLTTLASNWFRSTVHLRELGLRYA